MALVQMRLLAVVNAIEKKSNDSALIRIADLSWAAV
jgi:hypothetical protein